MSFDDPYVYRASGVLRNKLGVQNAARFELTERRIVTQRSRQGIPQGDFDLNHLRAIHCHIFQDIYDWAGELRTVEISKEGHQFQFSRFVQTGMTDVHRRVVAARYPRDLDVGEFASIAGEIIGNVNYAHPFRDGNGRTQLQYLRQLAEQAGHLLDLTRLNRAAWLAASRAAHNGDYAPMADEIVRIAER